jgi:hypothetical protein
MRAPRPTAGGAEDAKDAEEAAPAAAVGDGRTVILHLHLLSLGILHTNENGVRNTGIMDPS